MSPPEANSSVTGNPLPLPADSCHVLRALGGPQRRHSKTLLQTCESPPSIKLLLLTLGSFLCLKAGQAQALQGRSPAVGGAAEMEETALNAEMLGGTGQGMKAVGADHQHGGPKTVGITPGWPSTDARVLIFVEVIPKVAGKILCWLSTGLWGPVVVALADWGCQEI